jgi:putative tricarboxylic transport membrane protein
MWHRVDVIACFLLIFVGVGVMFESIRLQIGTPLRPQPGLFPLLGGLLLVGLSLFVLTQRWLRRSTSSQEPRAVTGELRRPLILIASLGVYAAILGTLGFVLPTFILTGLILRVLGVKSWKILCLASLALSLGTYVLFGRILGIDLPEGALSFLH